MVRTVNLVEGFFWIAVGACLAVSLVRPGSRGLKALAAVNFAAFGGSDFVEMHTRGWWEPWWLLAWKAGCVGVMLALLIVYVRRRTAGKSTGTRQKQASNIEH